MSYVPIVVPQEQPPSPRTRELADLLARVIVDFEEKHPSITGNEVRQATRLAMQASRGGGQPALFVSLLLGGMLLLGLGAYLFFSANGGGSAEAQLPILAVGVLIAIAAVLAVVLRRGP